MKPKDVKAFNIEQYRASSQKCAILQDFNIFCAFSTNVSIRLDMGSMNDEIN